jgi:hypothetical protein
MTALAIRPVGPADFVVVETLFGPRGACAGCWCDLAPHGDYARLGRARKLQRPDRDGTWSIPCFFIKRSHRRRGVAHTGLPSMFEAAGFHPVASTDPGSRTIYLRTR